MNKKRISVIFAVIFITTIIICICIWLFYKQFIFESPIAFIYQNNKIAMTIPLDNFHNGEYKILCENGYNTIKVDGRRISVIEADCPDKTCVHMGWIGNGLVPIACIPHSLVIQIQNDLNTIDAVAR